MTLSDRSVERVHLLYEIAKRNGSLITVGEIVPLLPEPASEAELVTAFRESPILNTRFELTSGYLTEKAGAPAELEALERERASRERAATNMEYVRRFAPLVRYRDMELVAVSGSTSYRSASLSSDLDLFCVMKRDTLWIALIRALLLAKGFMASHPDSPSLCFSCVMDSGFASQMFSNERSALFARDALQTAVVSGHGRYRELMGRARWISELYPSMYMARTAGERGSGGSAEARPGAKRVLNLLLFLFVGSYLRGKAWALNRRLHKRGQGDGAFAVRMGADHLIYESARYAKMREAYGDATSEPTVQIC